ncbi:MAG: lysine--tRNA ligase [Candidatus Omnitrophica bacterium]|nr:lysine--tRNA ligase [Candidatus Omnitrophota bacterium]
MTENDLKIKKIKFFQDLGLYDYSVSFLRKRISVQEVLDNFKEQKEVVIAGRLMAKRLHGKAIFFDLKDFSGKLQVYIKEDTVGKELFEAVKSFDIGDIALFKGQLFKTRAQEPTLNAIELHLLSKSLRPLPEKWHGLRDIETRYRQRYLDIISNEEVKKVFLLRSQLIKEIRHFLDNLGFMEVETPMMQTVAGGARGRPFKTYHNEYGFDLYLRIAPELYLKRLLVAGFEKIYELNRNFRNEGISTKHSPEFTMLEIYSAYSDYQDMMDLTKKLIVHLARTILGKEKLIYQDKTIDLSKWQEISFAKLMKEKYDINPDDEFTMWIDKLRKNNIIVSDFSRSFIINLISELVEPEAETPVFVTDLFSIFCPLAKRKKDNPFLSERFELFMGGIEIANAYSELNDPIEQRERFKEELENLSAEEKREIDEDFLLSLEYGMPPAGGLGIGIDRLAMIFFNQSSIRDVIIFPLLKPY